MARLVAFGVLLLTLAAGSATAKAPASPRPWATVNVCDTPGHPNAIGVRASMPGAARKQVRLYARFRVQWRDPSDRLWHNLLSGGDSGFVALGRAKAAGARQAGQVFRYQAPAAGKTQQLRGRVDFEWRIAKHVVRREQALTQKGHRSAAGSDPKGYSAATCTLKAP
jgi:hypothetical protein